MAQRLSFGERARIEAMQQAGVRVADTARRLGRDPSTVPPDSEREIKFPDVCDQFGVPRVSIFSALRSLGARFEMAP